MVGKNLGGSVASYAIDDSVSCLVATGSVPRLSRFWAESLFPVAVENRKGFSAKQISHFQAETRQFDLTESAARLPMRYLIQFGQNDPWIESQDVLALESKLTRPPLITWLNDGHAMSADPTVTARIEFIRGCL